MPEEKKTTAEVEEEVDLLEQGNLSDLFDFPADPQDEKPVDEPKAEEKEEETQQPESAEADTETETETEEVEVSEQKPKPEGQGETKPVTFKYRGKEYSFDDLQKDQDLFTKVITGANQQSHYQELYEKQRQEATALQQQMQQFAYQQQLEAQQRAMAQQQDTTGGITPDVVKGHYNRQLDTMVKEGWIEEDIKELYPNVATGMLFLRDTLLNEVAALKRQVADLTGYSQGQYQEQVHRQQEITKQQVRSVIENIFNNIAAEGGIFEPLKDKSVRTEFIHELQQTVNPEIQAIIEHPTILRDLWIAKNHATILQAAKVQSDATKAVTEKKRRMASAEAQGSASSGRKGSNKPVPGTEEGWGDLFE